MSNRLTIHNIDKLGHIINVILGPVVNLKIYESDAAQYYIIIFESEPTAAGTVVMYKLYMNREPFYYSDGTRYAGLSISHHRIHNGAAQPHTSVYKEWNMPLHHLDTPLPLISELYLLMSDDGYIPKLDPTSNYALPLPFKSHIMTAFSTHTLEHTIGLNVLRPYWQQRFGIH
jgi:hypothetical protein